MPTTTFQQGGSYTGTVDITIDQANPNSSGATSVYLYDDAGTGVQKQSLLEFTNLFGTGAGQIPVGATITSATLTINVADPTASGGGIYRMTSGWDGTSTWNSLAGGVQIGTETAATADVTLGKVTTGAKTYNVTSSLNAWLSGATSADQANGANHGWLFSTTSTDGWHFSSSEGTSAPVLTVTYTMPTTTPPPAAQLALEGPISLNEGTGSSPTAFTFTVDRTGDTSSAGTVDYSVAGTGANPADASDFAGGVLPSGTISFAAGQSSQTITVNVAADSAVESNETFSLSLSNATNGATITTGTTTGTIVNDDVTPAQLALEGPLSLNEGTGSSPTAFTFTVDRTGDTSSAGTVDYSVAGSGTNPADASDFADGVLPSGTVSFAAGQTSATITVNVAADSVVENNETFSLSLANASNGATIANATTTGTIVNDDVTPAHLALEGPLSFNEGTGSSPTAFTFTIDRTGDTTSALSVNYGVTGSGTNAADASDFAGGVLPSGTVNFAAGQTSATVTVNVAADSVVENNETFTLSLSNPTNGATITNATTTGTIVNDDTAPSGPVTSSFQQGATYHGTVDITIDQANPNSSGATSVYLYDDAGTGVQKQSLLEFTNLFGTGAGQIPVGATITSATLTINVADPTASGGGIYRMTSGWDGTSTWNSLVGGVQIGTETAATADVTLGKVTTGAKTYNVTSSLNAWLSGATSADQANGANHGWLFSTTSTDGWHFSSSEGTSAPVLTVTYTMPTTTPPPAAQLALEGPISLNEGTGSGPTAFTFTVDRTGDTSGAVSVNYGVTGSGTNPADASDFAGGVLPSGTISFAAGQTSQTITVNVAADSIVENNETFSLSLSNATNGATISNATTTGTIVNDDVAVTPAQLALEGPLSLNEGTSSTATAFTFTVDRTGDTSSAGTVDYSVAGSGTSPADASDFTGGVLPSGTVSFAAGQTSATITVNVAADSVVENNETFSLSLSNASNGATISNATTTGTIVNDDVPPPPPTQLALEGPVAMNEGTSESPTAFTFTIDRTGDTSTAGTVDYVVAGSGAHPATFSDFTSGLLPLGTVSFAAGQTSATVTINVVGDFSAESDETFSLTLSNASNGATSTNATTTGTIINDDPDSGVRGVRIINGSTYGNGDPSSVDHYGSTDPTDIAYDPVDHSFYLVDSEIDEKPFYGTVNMWHLDSQGNLLAPISLESFTKEPTGIAVWVDPSTGHQDLFITDDNLQKVFEVDAANPSVVLHSFSTKTFGAVDPEDISINPNNGDLFVLSEDNHKIYEVTQAGKLVATTVMPDTFVPHYDPNMEDGGTEALAYDAAKDVFYVTGGFSPDIFEVSRSGQILNMINVLEQYPNPSLVGTAQTVYPKGLELAPSSDGSGHLSLWVTDYGLDQYPDGRVIEIMLNETATQSATTSATTAATTTMTTAMATTTSTKVGSGAPATQIAHAPLAMATAVSDTLAHQHQSFEHSAAAFGYEPELWLGSQPHDYLF